MGRSFGIAIALRIGMAKRFVYGLRSASDRNRFYVGVTSGVPARIEWHNAGRCYHTVKYRPWELVVALEFATRTRLRALPQIRLGCAFAKRHFG
jgi:predicted GIY-YIG superfamily endonuclease